VIPFDSLILQLLLTFPSAGLALPQHGEIVRYAILNQNGSREENNINSYLVKAREAANKFTILNLLQANTACELQIQSWLITLVTFLLNNQCSTKAQQALLLLKGDVVSGVSGSDRLQISTKCSLFPNLTIRKKPITRLDLCLKFYVNEKTIK
jgi:hypothetical protein